MLSFDRGPEIIVRAGERELKRFRPLAEYQQIVRIARADLTQSKGRVTIETELVFVPGDRTGSPDRRQLGLKLFDVRVEQLR